VYPCRRISTSTSPRRSVRQISAPASSSMRMTTGSGCPNEFPTPTLTSAVWGSQPSSPVTVRPFTLPWCGTLSTSTSPSRPALAIPSCASASASPVSTASKPPRPTCSTTLVSFVPSSVTGSAGGHSTRTLICPTRHESPADTVRTSTSGPSHGAPSATHGEPTPGTPTQPIEVVPERPVTPPV